MFYQFIAGAMLEEQDHFYLEDPLDYMLLTSSGCYCLPVGPFSDDSIAMDELCAAMRTLGFKPKHMTSIFSLLVAILLLGNLEFREADHTDVSTHITTYPHIICIISISDSCWKMDESAQDANNSASGACCNVCC